MSKPILFTKEQQKILAIQKGLHLVLAPPGSGKTELLAARVENAVNKGYQEQEIICLTFTNRAAKGMKERVESKFPGNETEAFKSYEKAVELDTVMQNKVALMTDAAALAKKMGNRVEEAKWRGKIFYSDPKANKTDLYNYGFAYYQAGMYDSSLAVFGQYKTQYPDEIFGYLWSAKSAAALDTTMAEGKAVPDYIKLIEVAKKTDSVKYKSQIVGALFYLASYSNDVKKDKDAAVDYLTQVTQIDQAGSPSYEQAKKFITILTAPPPKQAPAKQPAAKPKTGTKTGAR